MLRRSLLIFTAILLYFGVTSSAFSSSLNEHEEECYAVAMVAYDTVINSNLGLPLDVIIDSMVKNNSEDTSVIFQDFLMLVVMDAYNWQGTPHTYAVKALYQCASKHSDVAHVY